MSWYTQEIADNLLSMKSAEKIILKIYHKYFYTTFIVNKMQHFNIPQTIIAQNIKLEICHVTLKKLLIICYL